MRPVGPLLAASLALASPGAAPAHPGHEAPIPGRPGETPPDTHGDSAVRLARVVLERGSAGAAARMIAREAAGSSAAAKVLADALERLGDAEGAALARGRAAELEARGRP